MATNAGSRPKVVMTLLARDEVDIVERNIQHHLAQGVDFIIATDNGSLDGTREVLAKYAEQGRLHLIDEPGRNKDQATWVNRMGRIACDDYRAAVVFHCDADEFWHSRSGDLSREILRGRLMILQVQVFNVLLADRQGDETLGDATWVVLDPIAKLENMDLSTDNLYLYRHPPKVITRTAEGYIEVTYGNHNRVDKQIELGASRDLYILHYPVRGREQFERKVVQTGAARMADPGPRPNTSFHLKQWYAHYLAGTLDADYRQIVVTDPEPLVAAGIAVDMSGLPEEEFHALVGEALTRRVPSRGFSDRVKRRLQRVRHPSAGG
jgi:hypothetical protein